MVSIIVPIYNSEKTLSSCVRSILNQTYPDYELILIDDGSSDRSGQICDELQESCKAQGKPCQVIHQENRGVSAARNCGMEHANGEFFVCVDSDDWIEPCYLEDLVHTAEIHPELGHVLCGFKCKSHVHDFILTGKEPLTIVSRRDYMLLFDKVLIQGPCLALYKTAFVRANHLKMRKDLNLAEDLIFNLQYLNALGEVPIGVINKANYFYQNDDHSSLFRKYRPDLLEINEMIMQSVQHYLVRWGVSDESAWREYYNAAFLKYVNVLDNTFNESNPMSKRDKLKYNNSVMQKDSFREAMEKSRIHLVASYRIAYRSGDYRMVLAAKRIEQFKKSVNQLLK